MKRRSSATGLNEIYASSIIKRAKVHAQRKFAQGSNNYVTTPTKLPKLNDLSTQPFSPRTHRFADNHDRELNNFLNLPTIDDFLTFLCYRETDVLPQRLNYLNIPQFKSTSAKKKTSKTSYTSSSLLPSSKSSIDHDEVNGKVDSNFKNGKKVPEYPLHSKEIKCKPIISKTSSSLALKHNQRLRKTVQTKFTENKLPNFKAKNSTNKSLTSKNNNDIKVDNVRKHVSRTKVFKETPETIDLEMKRVTRGNSNLNALAKKPEVVKSPAKISQSKSSTSVTKMLSATVNNSHTSAKRLSVKSLRAPVAILNSSLSPVRSRSTRSATARLESNLKTLSTSSRPTRKTKKAAALYIETLSKNLLRGDESFDENDLALESYIELPTEPMRSRIEIKETLKKPKSINSAEKKVSKLIKNQAHRKPLSKIYMPVRNVIKRDESRLEKFNDKLKKIVEDKPLKRKFEHTTKKSIDNDRELETDVKAGAMNEFTKLLNECFKTHQKSSTNRLLDKNEVIPLGKITTYCLLEKKTKKLMLSMISMVLKIPISSNIKRILIINMGTNELFKNVQNLMCKN